MLELAAQVAVYSALGFVFIVAGFYAMDLLTPGKLGHLVMDGNRNAAILSASTFLSIGLILWFAIFFTGGGWGGLDDVALYGAVGVAVMVVGFLVVDLLTPGKLGDVCRGNDYVPATSVIAAGQIAAALVVCASLT